MGSGHLVKDSPATFARSTSLRDATSDLDITRYRGVAGALERSARIPSVTKWNVAPPSIAIGSRAGASGQKSERDRALRVLDMINTTVTRMSDLIDDVLDFARGRLGSGIVPHASVRTGSGSGRRRTTGGNSGPLN